MTSLRDWPLPPDLEAMRAERERLTCPENPLINDDFEDFEYKLKTFTKAGLLVGGNAAMFHLFDYRPPLSHAAAYHTIFRLVTPFAVMGMTYPTIVRVTAGIRSKDDIWNHVAAGMATGSVWGARCGSQRKGIAAGGCIAAIGVMFKYAHMQKWPLFRGFQRNKNFDDSPIPPQRFSMNSHKVPESILKDSGPMIQDC